MKVAMPMTRGAKGFTLIELVVSVAIFGIMILVVMPLISMAFTFREQTKRDENTLYTQKIASGLMSYARTSNNGRLPPPYTGGDSNSTVHNPADVSAAGQALSLELRNTGVPVSSINTDGSAVRNVRVYQVVSGLNHTLPFYFTTGTQVVLTYDVGALVQTLCPISGACNSGTPGTSAAFTSSNITSWMPSGTDYGGIVFSTLGEQKQMLRQTAGRINKLSDRLSSEFYTRMRLAAANSSTNFYPLPTNAGAPVLVTANPLANMGCHNGWYQLGAANVNILAQIGLDPAEFGFTAWGGIVEYCADYDPIAIDSTTANQAPHYAALRINRDLSSGGAPSNVSYANNVVITF